LGGGEPVVDLAVDDPSKGTAVGLKAGPAARRTAASGLPPVDEVADDLN
jgi:hypothetical protein